MDIPPEYAHLLAMVTVVGAAASEIMVDEGDTLWTLAESLGMDWRELQAANGLTDDLIYAGETLRVPPRPSLRQSALGIWTGNPPLRPLVVEAGDTAWDIAQRIGVSVEELQEVNSIVLDVLFPGDVLYVPERPAEWLRRRQVFRMVRPRLKGLSAFANATFFDAFPPQKDIDEYRERHRLLLNALRHVESSFIMPAPTGDGGLSIGPLQISPAYHEDAWWLASKPAKYEHCEEVEYAERTVVNYWLRYCPWALEFDDLETLARTHNGGPQFWYHMATIRYWGRVRRALRRQGYYKKDFPELQLQQRDSLATLLLSMHLPFPLECTTSLEASSIGSKCLPCIPPVAIQDTTISACSSSCKGKYFQEIVSRSNSLLLDHPVPQAGAAPLCES